jgi:hypothetical protein
MQIPRFWAEAREQDKSRVDGKARSVTVRRWGWSSESQAVALRHAEERARDALGRILGGEKLPRIEARVSYGGADGQPIREELLEEREEGVITRNAYGARCMNVSDVLFADVDFDDGIQGSCGLVLFTTLCVTTAGLIYAINLSLRSTPKTLAIVGAAFVLGLIASIPVIAVFSTLRTWILGSPWEQLRKRLRAFADRNPDWHLRLYKSPAGARILALHRTFDPQEDAVRAFFEEMRVDFLYRFMCEHQRCFRARVSPKPWRIGMNRHIQPRGVWHPDHAQNPERQRWLRDYEALAPKYASCSYVESFGSDRVDPKAAAVLAWHDELSQANSGKPIA